MITNALFIPKSNRTNLCTEYLTCTDFEQKCLFESVDKLWRLCLASKTHTKGCWSTRKSNWIQKSMHRINIMLQTRCSVYHVLWQNTKWNDNIFNISISHCDERRKQIEFILDFVYIWCFDVDQFCTYVLKVRVRNGFIKKWKWRLKVMLLISHEHK